MAAAYFSLFLCLLFTSAAPAGGTYAEKLEKKTHELVNSERVKAGLKPFAYSAKLSSIARNHSLDMAAKNYTDHVNKDGLNPSDRAKKSGYDIIKKNKNGYRTGVGENIHESRREKEYNGKTTPYLASVDEVAAAAVKGWMNSPGHRKNIINPDYTLAGTGISVAKDRTIRITQVFF